MSLICPICDSPATRREDDPTGRDATLIDCPLCGNYAISRSLDSMLPHLRATEHESSARLSHALRRAADSSDRPLFSTYTAEAAVKQPLPRPSEQADLLIRWLAEHVAGPGETLWIEYSTHGAVIGAKSTAGFELVLDHLFATGLVTGNQSKMLSGGDRAHATLTFSGWDHYETLRRGGRVFRKAFMAMKFQDALLDQVLETVFKPSALRAGFDLFKLTDKPKAGLIDNQMRVEIQSCAFVVADLSHDNLGAYWEAGYAEGLGKPVIYTCEKSKFEQAKTHFDTNHHLTILWDAAFPSACSHEFVATIRATLPHLANMSDGAA
jgi:nucleoside 2-deoxyribosyltransferase